MLKEQTRANALYKSQSSQKWSVKCTPPRLSFEIKQKFVFTSSPRWCGRARKSSLCTPISCAEQRYTQQCSIVQLVLVNHQFGWKLARAQMTKTSGQRRSAERQRARFENGSMSISMLMSLSDRRHDQVRRRRGDDKRATCKYSSKEILKIREEQEQF